MKDIYDDLEELKQDDIDEPETETPNRRFSVILISLFLVILMASYIIIGFPMRSVIFGQMRSDTPSGNILRTRDLDLVFEGETLEKATEAWHENRDVETTLCMHGERKGDTYILHDAYEPEIYEQSFTYVRHEACDDDTILLFHTHPYKRCIGSEADDMTLRDAQRLDPDIAMIIMCEQDRFSVYT
ncbi:MAG: hypothetical protein ACLFTR_01215 [Candidatus Woesearchaeota archaeon]